MKNRLFRLGSEASWVFGGQIGVAVGGLIGIKILTHLLNPFEFGRLSIANIIILLVSANVFGPIGQGLMRYWSISMDEGEFAAYVTASDKYIKTLVCYCFMVAALLGAAIFFSQWRGWAWVVVLSIVSGALAGWTGIRLSTLMAARKRKHVAIINVLSAFAKPIAAAVLIFCITLRAEVAVLGFLSVAGISTFFAERYFKKTATFKLRQAQHPQNKNQNREIGKLILSFSYPFFIWSFFAWAHQSCDRWALLAFQGADVVGAYSVIAQLAYYPLVFGSAFLTNFFIPIAYERAGKLQSTAAVNAANKILLTMVCLYISGSALLTILFYLFSHQLVLLISNANYLEYAGLLPMLTAAWSLYYLGQVLSGFGFLANKPNLYIMPIVCCGLLATMTSFYLAFNFGIIGIIWALGITGLIYAGWCLIIAKRLMVSCIGA